MPCRKIAARHSFSLPAPWVAGCSLSLEHHPLSLPGPTSKFDGWAPGRGEEKQGSSRNSSRRKGGGRTRWFPEKNKSTSIHGGEVYHDGARERHSEKMRGRGGGIGRSGDSEASAMKAQFWSVTEAHTSRDSRLVLERITSPTLCSTMFIFPSRGLFRR